MHVLILGGTTEANELAGLLAARSIDVTLSLAGRTKRPVLPQGNHRIGGFGGAEGLANWLRENNVTEMVDATHPFARRMAFNAEEAARIAGVPLLSLMRPAWEPQMGDCWTQVDTHEEAIRALGDAPRRVFLTVGRMEMPAYTAAPQHFYAVRSIEDIEKRVLPNAAWITGRGPFTVADECALMHEHGVDCVVTKNSGANATGAKLAAARELGLPVIILNRPEKPPVERVTEAKAALEWVLSAHGISS